MPAASDVPSAFAFLHTRTLASFGTTFKMWWPTARKGRTYTTRITAAAAPVSARAAAVIGALIIPEDALILHATKSEFPYEPAGEDLFYWGETVNTGKKYRILTVTTAQTNHAHYRITAQFASGG